MTDYATVQSHKCGCGGQRSVGCGGGWRRVEGLGGGQFAFVGKKRGSPKSLHKSSVSFAVLLTNDATFIKGLCHCTLIVLKCELLSEERK